MQEQGRLVFLQEPGWLCLKHGCCREMANDGACSAATDLQSSPSSSFFLSEKDEGDSWEGVEERARLCEELMETHGQVF